MCNMVVLDTLFYSHKYSFNLLLIHINCQMNHKKVLLHKEEDL